MGAGQGAEPERVEAESFFSGGARRPVKSLGGIQVDLVVRLFEHEGPISVRGDVPDDALLAVKNGTIELDGFAAGHLIADGGIHLRGNAASGHVVSRQGGIQVEGGILSNARVVAQCGAVDAGRLEGPHCVFGWEGVRVRGDVRGGSVFGRSVHVEGAVAGAALHAIAGITAGAFEAGRRGPSVVCLRDTIASDDYGRPMSEDERRLTRGIGKHHYDASLMTRLIRYATRDIQDAQRTVLYLLLGGQLNAQRIHLLRGLQCQRVYVSEILGMADRLIAFARQRAGALSDSAGEQAHLIARECQDSLKTLEDDVRAAAAAFALEHRGIIIGACTELQQWAHIVQQEGASGAALHEAARAWAERAARWTELSDQLTAAIAEQVAAFNLRAEVVQAAESQPDRIEGMLQQVVSKLVQDPGSERAERLRIPVVRLINTLVERNRKNIQNWQRTLETAAEEIRTIHRALGATSATLFAYGDAEPNSVTANAFAADTVIVANPLPNTDPILTAAAIVRLSQDVAGPATFQLRHGAIQRT